MAMEQSTIASAGLDPFTQRVTKLDQRRDQLTARDAQLQEQQSRITGETERLITERGEATKAPRQALMDKARQAPPIGVKEEEVKDFERPTMNPKDLQESFGLMLAASLMTGLASRTPFYNAMNSLAGGMKGFMDRDSAIVKESFAAFDRNIGAIRERNAQKRRAVEDAWKTYQHDLEGLKRELELIAAQYDDPLALQAARSKSITEAQKLLEKSITATDTATERLMRDKANMEAAQARIEESRARRAEAQERHNERMDRLRAQDAERTAARDAKLTSTRFKDVTALRKEYQADTKAVRGDLDQVERIIKYANTPSAFSDVQLRQAVSQFQKGARGTNAMIASMVNFGSLDERIAGTINRFIEGEYLPEQRGEIKNLFTTIRDQVLQPGLNQQKAKFRYLAEQNRLPAEQVVVELEPLVASEHGAVGVDPGATGAPGGAAPAPAPDFKGFSISPAGGS